MDVHQGSWNCAAWDSQGPPWRVVLRGAPFFPLLQSRGGREQVPPSNRPVLARSGLGQADGQGAPSIRHAVHEADELQRGLSRCQAHRPERLHLTSSG